MSERVLDSPEARALGLHRLDDDEARVVQRANQLMAPLIDAFMALPLDPVPVDHAPPDRAPGT